MDPKYQSHLKEIVLKHVPLNEFAVFLFGSRAAKNNHERSDIDIGVWGKSKLPTLIKLSLEHELEESRIPFFVDIIDFSSVTEGFKNEALRNKEIWNWPENLRLN